MIADIKYLVELAEEMIFEVKRCRTELAETREELKEIKQQLSTAPQGV